VDLVVERHLSSQEISDGIAKVLSIEPTRVAVIEDMAEYPNRAAADVVCVATPALGQFAQVLSIQCRPMAVGSYIEVSQRVADTLKVAVLVPSEGSDPYVMWLVRPNIGPELVSLNAAALDDDRYIVDRE
jgi:hypothetical protein